jgi:LCCL domain
MVKNRYLYWPKGICTAILAGFLFVAAPRSPGQENNTHEAILKKNDSPPAGAVEIRLLDESNLKVVLCDEKIELLTRHGKLDIPVAEIIRIDFRLRIPEGTKKKIAVAVAELGHEDYSTRQRATNTLLSLREKSYPSLVQASKNKDPEVARRAEVALDKLRETLPGDTLEFPATDVVHTSDSIIAGQINMDSFRVTTLSFGDQQLRLTDIRSLNSQLVVQTDPILDKNAPPAPETLNGYERFIGSTFALQVTAPTLKHGAVGEIWGTNVYTMGSKLAVAAVHAGALKPGKTGVVRVTVVGLCPGFPATQQNGIMSQANGEFNGYRIEVPKYGVRKN